MASLALVAADMINDFMDPAGSLYVGEAGRAIIPFVAARIRDMRRQGAVIIFLNNAHDPADPEFRRFPPHAIKGTWGAQIIPELKVAETDHLVGKTHYSGMVDGGLQAILQREKVEEVHLLGVCTSICIMETARDLDLHGYRVVVYRAGVADLDRKDHEWGLARMARLFGVKVV